MTQDSTRDLQKFVKSHKNKRKHQEKLNNNSKKRKYSNTLEMENGTTSSNDTDSGDNVDNFKDNIDNTDDDDFMDNVDNDDDNSGILMDTSQPVLPEELLLQLKQLCDEVESVDLTGRIPVFSEFTNIGDFYTTNFAEIIKNHKTKQRLCLQVTNNVSDLINDVISARQAAKEAVPNKNVNLDKWRLEMAILMCKKVVFINL